MLFSLDVLRGKKGDCLMLHYGSKDDPRLVMIDGGPRGVYGPHLKPRIGKIREKRGLADDEPLPVDLLMVSHVDDDHIQGILDLTREMKTAQLQSQPQLLQVLSFWHNSFENIIGSTPKELEAAFKSNFGAASMGGEPPEDLTVDADLDEREIVANLKVLASIQQGAQLRSDADSLGFPLNPEFDGKLIMVDGKAEPLDMGDGLTLTVVGPMVPELENLHAKHQAWLEDLEEKGKSAEDVLAAYVDESVPNLSSIVVLAEADGKSMLLTGDARGDNVLEALELMGLLKEGQTMHVDVLKVPHHGSANNLEKGFFQSITADHYVFSGDGEHGNPERESLEMLLAARGNADYTIHLTYPVDFLDEGRKEDWEKEQNKQKKKHAKNSKVKVRDDWSPEEHSLAGLFEANPDFGKKVRVIKGDTEPHVIDLLEKIGF